MNCTSGYLSKFEEVRELAALAETTSGNISLTQKNTMCSSGLVLLCGYFEGFLRDICKEFVNEINDSSLTARGLPDSVMYEHTLHCVEKYKIKNKTLFCDLISAISESNKVELNADKFSATNANPTVDNIERLFEAFDMPLILDVISIEDYNFDSMYNVESQVNASMLNKIHLAVGGDDTARGAVLAEIERKWVSKRKRRRVGYVGFIDELLKVRNRIAHGESNPVVTPTELSDAVETISILSISLEVKLDSKLQLLLNQPAQ
ncbi:MAE_28990/MAE_18760 family HEPN-like nuclease [Serratia sp. NGAS9]|uniref:MAE_28990/MAE_18760 family HEPN-like nuclease n=1 Tax=Serratia sp. NGAS9 TaxID=2697369 RepID=UPI0013672224|nr:hypothetical protein GUC32_07965 [Serratia sp. NGAS9]